MKDKFTRFLDNVFITVIKGFCIMLIFALALGILGVEINQSTDNFKWWVCIICIGFISSVIKL